MGEYFDLGDYTRPVTTSSPAAQLWFTRGLLWAYAFNHEEAMTLLRAGHRGRSLVFALAYWGLAYAARPELQQAMGSVRQDVELRASVSRAPSTATQRAAILAQGGASPSSAT